MASISRLRTKPERLRSEQADVLRQALLPFADGELAPHVRALVAHIDRQAAAQNGWTFVMLSPEQFGAVVDHLAKQSSRPIVAMRMWALFFRHLSRETGEIMLSRNEIADAVEENADNVSRVMSELVAFGAISRRVERVPGLRGRGRARYYVNPRVATHLAGKERDQAQEQAPALRLV